MIFVVYFRSEWLDINISIKPLYIITSKISLGAYLIKKWVLYITSAMNYRETSYSSHYKSRGLKMWAIKLNYEILILLTHSNI